jgi:hypothetical protein
MRMSLQTLQIVANRQGGTEGVDTRVSSMILQHPIPDSRLRDEDVIAELSRLRADTPDYMAKQNRALISFLRKDCSHPLLLRGIGAGSPNWLSAADGTALTDSGWVRNDYPRLTLPSASYWSDPSLEVTEVFWALAHAFGGDHPQAWMDAQNGIVLAHAFELKDGSVRPADHVLLTPNTAWKFHTGRDEYLAFAPVTGCWRLFPWDLVRAATETDTEAEMLLCAAYLDYLEDQIGSGIGKSRATALLQGYRP